MQDGECTSTWHFPLANARGILVGERMGNERQMGESSSLDLIGKTKDEVRKPTGLPEAFRRTPHEQTVVIDMLQTRGTVPRDGWMNDALPASRGVNYVW